MPHAVAEASLTLALRSRLPETHGNPASALKVLDPSTKELMHSVFLHSIHKEMWCFEGGSQCHAFYLIKPYLLHLVFVWVIM